MQRSVSAFSHFASWILPAILVAAAVTVRVARPASPPAVAAPEVATFAEAAALPDDPSLDLVADLTDDVDWGDAAVDAGLTIRAGAADTAVTQLTDGERVELQRLLEQELRSAGN